MQKVASVVVGALAVVICTTAFAQSRTHLAGYNGIAFGTPIAKAAKTLGPSFKRTAGAEGVLLLDKDARAFGKDFQVAYTFDPNTKAMTRVDMSAVISGGNETCVPRWQDVLAMLKGRYGEPDSDENHLGSSVPIMQSEEVVFKFQDGRAIEASLEGGCAVFVNFESAPGGLK